MTLWSPAAQRVRRTVFVLMVGMLAIGATVWFSTARQPAAARSAGQVEMPRSSAIEDRYGIRVLGAYLTAANGMIEVQYQVLDHDKALGIGDAKPIIKAHGTTFDVDGLAGHGHGHHVPAAGRNGFVLLANTKGALHEGETIAVVVGSLSLDGVVLE